MRINLHNLIELIVEPSFPWLSDWKEALGDIVALSPCKVVPVRSVFNVEYHPRFRPSLTRNVGDNFRIGPEEALDVTLGVELLASDENVIRLRASKPALEWLIWGIQLALVRAQATLIHCAALEKSGKAFLFPSWGGIGKTALVTEMVRSFGFRVLGDDMVIVDHQGTCYGFPKPLVLYPYHRPFFPEVFNSGRGPMAPVFLNSVLTRLAVQIKPLLRWSSPLLQLARKYYIQRAFIKPSEVFGPEKLAAEARVELIVWIDRIVGMNHSCYCEIDDTLLASRVFASTINEFDLRCVRLAHLAMGVGILNTDQLYMTWINVLNKVCRQVKKGCLYLPADLPLADMIGTLQSTLDKYGIVA